MILHVVIFKWQDGVTPEQVKAFSCALDALGTAVGVMRSLQHGSDLVWREGNGDYVLVATFDDAEAWKAYQSHPAHVAFVTHYAKPMQQYRIATQVEI